MDEADLRAWAVAFRDGDRDSFKKLVDTLSRTLIAMAYRYTGDWEWARDLTQDTWIKVHQRIRQFDPSRSFSAWLHSVHRHVCLDHLRRPWVQLESTPGARALAEDAGPAPDDPAADLERREFHDRLLVAAGRLSESQRQVFVRVDLEQKAQSDVARELDIKFGTLRTTLHFARKRVAAALRAMEEEGT